MSRHTNNSDNNDNNNNSGDDHDSSDLSNKCNGSSFRTWPLSLKRKHPASTNSAPPMHGDTRPQTSRVANGVTPDWAQ